MFLPKSTPTRMPSGMDEEVETEGNWERFQESAGLKTRERTSPEPEAVGGSSTITMSTPLQLQYTCRTPSALFSLTLVLFALPALSHSPSFTASLHPLHLGIIMDELRKPPPSVPYCARPRSRGLAPQQRLHLLSHLPTWTAVYTRSYSLPPQCLCQLTVNTFSCHTFAALHRLLPLPFANLS